MLKELGSRLIIAADFNPASDEEARGAELAWLRARVLDLAEQLREQGVIIKVNSALRALGLRLIDELHELGVKVFADLKLHDIPATMRIDTRLLSQSKPEMLTVMCAAGVDGMRAAREAAQEFGCQVYGVTVLTSLDEEESQSIYGCSARAGVLRFARMAELAGLAGLILSPHEAGMVRKHPELDGLELIAPGIRPTWSIVEGDDQKRSATPADAIAYGADRLIIGRPITGAKRNDQGLPQTPMGATIRTLKELGEELAEQDS